jgi:hypothetical protein
MNRIRVRIAILALPLAGLGVGLGCLGQAERTYFDDLVDGSVGSADGTMAPVEASPGIDSSMPTDADIVTSDDATDAPPTTADGPYEDGGALDAFADARPDADAAPIEAGCGPTTTVTNCGQCGAACDTTHGTPSSCTAGACKYVCNPGFGDCQPSGADLNGCETPLITTSNCSGCGIGCDTTHVEAGATCTGTSCAYNGCSAGWLDCNKATAPNADGCECNAPACCEAGACEPQHDNGLGQTFYDCTPLGQYNSALALKACTAYTGSAVQCVQFPCMDVGTGPIICSSGNATKNCLCWAFGGSNAGLFDNAGGPPGRNATNCYCPDLASGDTPWQ